MKDSSVGPMVVNSINSVSSKCFASPLNIKKKVEYILRYHGGSTRYSELEKFGPLKMFFPLVFMKIRLIVPTFGRHVKTSLVHAPRFRDSLSRRPLPNGTCDPKYLRGPRCRRRLRVKDSESVRAWTFDSCRSRTYYVIKYSPELFVHCSLCTFIDIVKRCFIHRE